MKFSRDKFIDDFNICEWHGCSGEHLGMHDQFEADAWCGTTVKHKLDWCKRGYDYWFRRRQDTVLFILRWGG